MVDSTPRVFALLLLATCVTGCDARLPSETATDDDASCRPPTTRPARPQQDEAFKPATGFRLQLCGNGGSSWRRITDLRNGKSLDLATSPQRVLSQSLGSDELLLTLLPEVERHRLLAVSALAISPRYSDVVKDAERIQHVITDKTEEILALAPDLVLAASYTTPDTLRQLENARVPTIVLHQFGGVDDAIANIRTLAFALFLEDEGERMIAALETTLDEARGLMTPVLQQQTANQPIRVLAYGAGSVYARGTSFDDLATRLGLHNLPSADGLTGWPRADQERLLTWQPQFVFLSAPEGAEHRSIDFFRNDFAELFRPDNGPSDDPPKLPPTILVLPDRLFSTVSQRLGDLAVEMARQVQNHYPQ